jgi:hypothetical protein
MLPGTPSKYWVLGELSQYKYKVILSPSGICDVCGAEAGMVTPKGSMSAEGETLQVSI